MGYGLTVASQPASLVLDLPKMESYVSNGSVKLPFTVYVMDQTGLNVTSGTPCSRLLTEVMPCSKWNLYALPSWYVQEMAGTSTQSAWPVYV